MRVPTVPDNPQTTMTPAQAEPSDVEDVAKLAEQQGLTVEEYIGQKPWYDSRAFNTYRWADHKPFNDCIEQLAHAIERHEGRKRARSGDAASGFRDAIRALVLDLYVAHQTDPQLQVGINLNANSFSRGPTRYRTPLTYKQFKAAYEGLKALGYVVMDKKGFYDRTKKAGKNTKIRATDKLVALLTDQAQLHLNRITRLPNTETILLKDRSKKLIDYEDTDETRTMRANLARINAVLQRCWIDLEITDAEFEQLQSQLGRDPDPEKEPIDFTKRTLYRPFNNGSFEEGGRFYGGWWQSVPKEYRPFITINGKRSVELDYSGLHPRMLYAIAGKELPDEPYDIGIDPRHRQLVKKAFNAIVNAGEMGVKQFDDYDAERVGLEWSEFLDRIKLKHSAVAGFFFTGYGVKLQYLDSSVAEKVLLHFLSGGTPCLPIHDSFIMHSGYQSELDDVMSRAYREVMNAEIPVKAKVIEIVTPGALAGATEPRPVTKDLDELLAGRPDYQGYDGRIERWLADRACRGGVTDGTVWTDNEGQEVPINPIV